MKTSSPPRRASSFALLALAPAALASACSTAASGGPGAGRQSRAGAHIASSLDVYGPAQQAPQSPRGADADVAPGGSDDAAGAESADAGPGQGPQLSASAWLERALEALQRGLPEQAGAALRAALATGDLNDAGRTLAYWYVYVAEQAQGHVATARNALADFVVVGQDVLAGRRDVRYAESRGSDFVDRFDLEGRLARSRATLSLAWAVNVPSFGRSAAQAVPVRNDQEMAYFLELAPPCAHRLDRRASYEVLSGSEGLLTRAALTCGNLTAPVHYYFAGDAQAPHLAAQPGAHRLKLPVR